MSTDTERRARMAELQHDPSPVAGHEFWKLAFPDLEAAFWATRRANEGGSNP